MRSLFLLKKYIYLTVVSKREPCTLHVAKSSTSFGSGKGGNVTSAGWQVTLCDPTWHVSSHSGVAMLHCELLYPYTLLYFTTAPPALRFTATNNETPREGAPNPPYRDTTTTAQPTDVLDSTADNRWHESVEPRRNESLLATMTAASC